MPSAVFCCSVTLGMRSPTLIMACRSNLRESAHYKGGKRSLAIEPRLDRGYGSASLSFSEWIEGIKKQSHPLTLYPERCASLSHAAIFWTAFCLLCFDPPAEVVETPRSGA